MKLMKKPNKKSFVFLCSMLLLFGSITAYASTDKKYDGNKSAAYAEKWALKYNTQQYYNASLDCTNFVSQCLVAGGKTISSTLPSYADTNYWRPHSATWENANYFKKYWKSRVASSGKSLSGLLTTEKYSYSTKLYNKLKKGDVIQYGYGTDDMRHSQICYAYGHSSAGYATLIMAQHTDNRKDIALLDYMAGTGYTYVRSYQMKELK